MDTPGGALQQPPQSLTALLLSFSSTPIPDPIQSWTQHGETEGCGIAAVEGDEYARERWSGTEQEDLVPEAIADPIHPIDELLDACDEDSSSNVEPDLVQSCEDWIIHGQCSGSKEYLDFGSAHHAGGSECSSGDVISSSPMGRNPHPKPSSRGAESTTPCVPDVAADYQQTGPEQSSWRRRIRLGKIPDQREPNQGRVSALEKAMRSYVDWKSGQVVAPEIGREFDSLAEAFEFYNLYSWEIRFGIRYGQSRTNAQKSKTVQDFVCGCSGRPRKENTNSVACNCLALIRLFRTSDNGWYIHDFRPEHNHSLSSSCGEKLHWPSHRIIDTHTKDIVKHLRSNNIGITKKLQFDRDSEENFAEKKSRLASAVLKTGLPMERHAGKVYTPALFKLFQQACFKSASYYVENTLVLNDTYRVTHLYAERRESWSKTSYNVKVHQPDNVFQCECGMYEHMGLLCCHAIRVMAHLRFTKIPEAHIMRRWTKNVRGTS